MKVLAMAICYVSWLVRLKYHFIDILQLFSGVSVPIDFARLNIVGV